MVSYFMYALILIALTIGLAVQENPGFNIDSFKDNLNWTHKTIEISETHPDLTNALESFINGLGEALFSLMKWVAEIAAQNPTVPFKLLIILTFLAIFAPVIILLFKLIVIIVILLKEYLQSRREKKRLALLKLGAEPQDEK